MKILLLSLILAVLFWGFSVPRSIRAIARIAADKMLYGKKTPTSKCINRCLAVLTWSNNWITNQEEPDNRRIDLLRGLLKEMQNPHG